MPTKSNSIKEIVKNCKNSLDELKAKNVCSYEVEQISSFTSFIIVASGTSGRHIQSIADKVIENLKTKKIKILGTEGMETKDWILIDAGEVIINIMSEDSREHYDLESLWDRKTK
tara:strand:- start:239 stop:583 length:345 start_codon:yes stop_codon:yes gene_type:complete